MKKLSLILAIAILFVAVFPLNVFAVKVGDEVGNVLNTDIKTYINEQRIPSYNINNKSAIFIKDLANYGFDTIFNEKNRTTTISYNPNKKDTPLKSFDETTGKVGTVAFRYVYTDIVAIINGRRIECFNVKGYNAIYFSELEEFGTFAWDNAKRESRFTLDNTKQKTETSNTREKAKDGYWFSKASDSTLKKLREESNISEIEYAKEVFANGSIPTKEELVGQWISLTILSTGYKDLEDAYKTLGYTIYVDDDGIVINDQSSKCIYTFLSDGTFTKELTTSTPSGGGNSRTSYTGKYEIAKNGVMLVYQTKNGLPYNQSLTEPFIYYNGKILYLSNYSGYSEKYGINILPISDVLYPY